MDCQKSGDVEVKPCLVSEYKRDNIQLIDILIGQPCFKDAAS